MPRPPIGGSCRRRFSPQASVPDRSGRGSFRSCSRLERQSVFFADSRLFQDDGRGGRLARVQGLRRRHDKTLMPPAPFRHSGAASGRPPPAPPPHSRAGIRCRYFCGVFARRTIRRAHLLHFQLHLVRMETLAAVVALFHHREHPPPGALPRSRIANL